MFPVSCLWKIPDAEPPSLQNGLKEHNGAKGARSGVSPVITAVGYGFIAAAPLLAGAWIALRWRPSERVVGFIAAFGAGALVSAIAYELVLDAFEQGASSSLDLALALAFGATVYYAGDRYLSHRGSSGAAGQRGLALMMGAVLDGIPESFILGMSLAAGTGVSVPFLVAVIVSNLPEGMASAAALKDDPDFGSARIYRMWATVVGISSVAAGVGAFVMQLGAATGATAQAFAAGALLTMLADDLIPEAREKAGIGAGLSVVFGFAVAFGLHQLGG